MADDDRDTLAAEVLHELRQPLMGLKAWLQLWQEDPARPANPATLLGQVERIEQILADYQRLVNRQPAPKGPAWLEPPVRAAVEAFSRQARGGGFPIDVQLSPGLRVTGNARLLEQLVSNLLANARDAAGPSGGRARVVGFERGDAVVLQVADWGPGIPRDVQENLFQAWNTGNPQGHGLGLVVCRRIADEHGATLELVEPERANIVPRPSTVFQVTFRAAASLPRDGGGAAPPGGGP